MDGHIGQMYSWNDIETANITYRSTVYHYDGQDLQLSILLDRGVQTSFMDSCQSFSLHREHLWIFSTNSLDGRSEATPMDIATP
jgi:hypothetical protein